MDKLELIEKAKELSLLDDLTGHAGEVSLLKKEWKRFNRESDDESFADKELADEFNKYYAKIAEHESSLNATASDEKKALINRAKEILEKTTSNFKKGTEEMNEVFTALKASGRCATKEEDDAFWNEFKSIKEQFFQKKQQYFVDLNDRIMASKAKKEDIICRAKLVLDWENMRDANNKMNELFEEWKVAGFAGRDNDNALWESFSAVRKDFFVKRKKHNKEVRAIYIDKEKAKEDIILKAKIILANSEFTPEEVNKMKALRVEWKDIGFAGRERDDELWNSFQEVVNKYFQELKSYK